MGGEPGSPEIRREQIRQRIDAIRARIKKLQAERRDDAELATVSERLTSAQRQMAASQAAARTAITNSLRAFRQAAVAHERAALEHERAAAAGYGDHDEHERQAASHRAAAVAARRRAERAQSLLSDDEGNHARGPDADQALNALLTGDLNRSGLHDALTLIRDLALDLVGLTCLAPSHPPEQVTVFRS